MVKRPSAINCIKQTIEVFLVSKQRRGLSGWRAAVEKIFRDFATGELRSTST
jgi:hypothetical protein